MNEEYSINKIDLEDVEEALRLVWRVFLAYEAPDYSEEGIQEFQRFIDLNEIKQKLADNQLQMWHCKNNGQTIGVLAARLPCHISLLFVDGEYHQKGIARSLFNTIIEYYKSYNCELITVNSSPYAKEIYHKLGFTDISAEQTINGIRFTPMEYSL